MLTPLPPSRARWSEPRAAHTPWRTQPHALLRALLLPLRLFPPQNHGGMNYWAPSQWDDVMATGFGRADAQCSQTSPGVFERQYGGRTVTLDCNKWSASFGDAGGV